MNISISLDNCIKCGKCVKVCPILVFNQEDKSAPIVKNPNRCFGCGHCVDICPTDSIVHELFPVTKVHSIDYNERPTPESLMLLLKSRRSNRLLQPDAVPTDLIDKIIEAASVAPTATNSQLINYTMVTDRLTLDRIIEFTIKTFENKIKFIDNALGKMIVGRLSPQTAKYIPAIKSMRAQLNKGNDMILRNAPALLIIHSTDKNKFGIIDGNLAYQNGSLMAESLGVSQIYAGFLMKAIKAKPKEFAQIIGTDESVCAAMILGMPAIKYPKYSDRKEITIKRI